MAIAPEVLAEYSAMTSSGAAAGASTLQRARAAVAARQAARQAAETSTPARPPQRPRGRQQQATGVSGQAARAAGRAYRTLPSAGGSPATRAVTRVICALAVGLIVLEIAAEATGQYWKVAIPSRGAPRQKEPYVPLYAAGSAPGRPAAAATGAVGSQFGFGP